MPEPLRVLDLDPEHGLSRLEHRASERLENVSVHRRELLQRAALDLIAFVAHDLGERLVDANVPKIVVEEPEAGRRMDEERVEQRALALGALGGPEEPVAQGSDGDRNRDQGPGTEDPHLGGVCERMRPAECHTPDSDDDENLEGGLPPIEVDRDEHRDTEIERRVELSGVMEERELGDDQRRGERHQIVRRTGKALVEADEREREHHGRRNGR